MKRFVTTMFSLTILAALLGTTAFAHERGSLDSAAQEISKIENVKETIFNNMLNSIDHYNAVEGVFTSTLLSDQGETVVSYATDISKQESYQSVVGPEDAMEVIANDGYIYTFDSNEKTYRVNEADRQIALSKRVQVDNSVLELPRVSNSVASIASLDDSLYDRVGTKDGMPVYHYRTDLTNTSYANASIFPQELTFGLLTDKDSWEITGTTNYVGREAVVIEGIVKDPIYAEKINASEFQLVVDLDSGIVLEFKGFDSQGNETESMKTTEINILKDGARSNVTAFVDDKLKTFADYQLAEGGDTVIDSKKGGSNSGAELLASNSYLIDNDTADTSNYYNVRSGFTAYLNDANYYNRDLRRALSNSADSYSWFMYDGPSIVPFENVTMNLDIYLYSSTSNDPAAEYAAETSGYEGHTITTMNQGLAPNGWNSYSDEFEFKNGNQNCTLNGITVYCSGRGSGYTGADAVEFTFE